MRGNSWGVCALLFVLLACRPAAADLFASLSDDGGILRLDFDEQQVVRSYAIADEVLATPPIAGLAFDGRTLYYGVTLPGDLTTIHPFDVVNKQWEPPVPIDPVILPGGQFARVTGLGYHEDDLGLPHLVAALRTSAEQPPSAIVSFEWLPGGGAFPTLLPPAPLPPDFVAFGADVDPATGDIWVSGGFRDTLLGEPTLLKVDTNGNELARLTPQLGVAVVRGVGFDSGRMFLGIRDLVNSANAIVEIDPQTGDVLGDFVLPASYGGILSGLAGGSVVPEPATWLLAACGLAGLLACRPAGR